MITTTINTLHDGDAVATPEEILSVLQGQIAELDLAGHDYSIILCIQELPSGAA